MVKITLTTEDPGRVQADAVAVGLFQDRFLKEEPARSLDRRLGGWIHELHQLKDFVGKPLQTHLLPTSRRIASPRLLLVGLGRLGEFKRDTLREAAARMVLRAREFRMNRIALALPRTKGFTPEAWGQSIAEGIHLALYKFKEYKSPPSGPDEEPEVEVAEARLLLPNAGARVGIERGVRIGTTLAEATNLARSLIMRPSIAKAPEELAKVAVQEARRAGCAAYVLTRKELEGLGMGLLLGVGSGSSREPRLVAIESKGRGKTVLLVGKGITFDSGGINIKPSEGMERMKYDMAGSATVLGAILAAARLRVKSRVVALMPLAENMPSGSAIRPGDILTAYNKKTVEVGNTDAEGRLVLADAIAYGIEKYKPDLIIDVATLTGAVRVALGGITTGILGNDDGLIRRLIETGRDTGDDLWQLPLNKQYEKQVESEVADVRNTGVGGHAGAIAGAAFLKKFVGDHKWAHLDIAGTCWSEKGPAELKREYLAKGATGVGVRLLTEFLRKL